MRSEDGVYLVDGPVLLAEALEARIEIETLYVEPDALDDQVVWDARRAGVRVRDTTPGALAKVLDLGAPQQMVAIAAQAPADVGALVDAALELQRPLLVLVALADPGNVGTLVRVAEATGCVGVVLSSNSVDPYNPKTVRATAGAIFRVPVAEGGDVDGLLERLALAGLSTVATAGGDAAPPPEGVDLTGAVAVVVGNEARGLDARVVSACSLAVAIPMEGRVESLNAGVAGAVVLFDAARQRRSGAAEPSGGRSPEVGQNDRPAGLTGDDPE